MSLKLMSLKPSPALLPLVLTLCSTPVFAETTLVNYSYTATKQMYAEYDTAFTKYWKGKTGESVTIKVTHANSSTQASKIKNGEEADIISASVPYDIDGIADADLLPANWQSRTGNNASPFTSTIVFLVRTGNPKGIKDWSDLVRWGVNIVMSNPKSSGGARWSHLAAYGYALKQPGGTEASARGFLKRLYANNRVLEYTARGATETFVKRKLGDVMVSWENEAFQAIAENPGEFEIVTPSISILAEPPVSVVDKVVDKHGTRKVAEAYVQYLYSPEGQDIAARNFYRPMDPTVAARYSKQFAPVKLFRAEELFGQWKGVQKVHFQDGGILDQVYDQYRNAS